MGFHFENLNALVAEDTFPMRELLISVLSSLGIGNITGVSDGREAFECFQQENHDIVLADWLMSPGDGLELTREIRTNALSPNRMVPIILLSGYSAWDRVAEARDVGITEFLIKPFSANDIARRVTHVINNPRNFIETPDFFGPDRRRRVDPNYRGPERRSSSVQVSSYASKYKIDIDPKTGN